MLHLVTNSQPFFFLRQAHHHLSPSLLCPKPLRPVAYRSYSPLPLRPIGLRSSRSPRRPRALPPSIPPATTPPPQTPSGSVSFPWTDYEALPPESRDPLTSGNLPPNSTGILQASHPAASLLAQPALVVVRQLEMLNLFIGFEQANRYRILNPAGNTVGFLAEEDMGFSGTILRQIAGTHRSFQATILSPEGRHLLSMRRPFSFINSRISIECPEAGRPIGEAQQDWHLWRRKYSLFTATLDEDERAFEQFAKIDAGFLAWQFFAQDAEGRVMGSVSRNFTGFGREIFTDTGQYVIRFEAVEEELNQLSRVHEQGLGSSDAAPQVPSQEVIPSGLSLDQRAVMLATAVSIDFDYFTRSRGGGLMPPVFFGGGSDELTSKCEGQQPSGPDPPTTGIGTGVAEGILSERAPKLDEAEQVGADAGASSQTGPGGWSETAIDEAWPEDELEDPWDSSQDSEASDWEKW